MYNFLDCALARKYQTAKDNTSFFFNAHEKQTKIFQEEEEEELNVGETAALPVGGTAETNHGASTLLVSSNHQK